MRAAHGWPAGLGDGEIPKLLMALDRERAEEERRGIVRWLRPEFQAPRAAAAEPVQDMVIGAGAARAAAPARWPGGLPESADAPVAPRSATRSLKGARPAQLADVLHTLVALG